MKSNLKQLLDYVNEDKNVYLRVIFFSIVIGILEFLGVSSLMPAVSLFLNGTVENVPNFLQPLIYFYGGQSFAIIFIIFIFIQTIIAILNEQYFVTQMARWRVSISMDYIQNILNAKFENFAKLKPGEIEVMITRNIGYAMKIRHRTAKFISDIVLALFFVGISLYISIYTIFLFVLLGLIYLTINRITIRLKVRYSKISQEKYLESARQVSEHFLDLRTLLSYNRNKFLDKVKMEIFDASIAQKNTDKINVLIEHINKPIMIILVFLSIYISKEMLFLDNSTILVMLYIFYRAAPSMIAVAKGYGEIIGDSPLDVTPEIRKWSLLTSNQKDVSEIPNNFNIVFNLDTLKIGNNVLINNLNIKIDDKEVVSFIGKSGSGKSTILDSVCGFLKLDNNSFTIGNISNQEIDYKYFLLKNVSLVRQEARIISGTVYDNIVYLSEDADRNRVEELISILGLNQFLGVRDGIDTLIGARGEGLSAGQKQRIILARALYKKPSLLILDEPTSNLDKKTEQDIIDIINSLKGKITILIASHSDDVVKISDKVYKIEDKKINQIK